MFFKANTSQFSLYPLESFWKRPKAFPYPVQSKEHNWLFYDKKDAYPLALHYNIYTDLSDHSDMHRTLSRFLWRKKLKLEPWGSRWKKYWTMYIVHCIESCHKNFNLANIVAPGNRPHLQIQDEYFLRLKATLYTEVAITTFKLSTGRAAATEVNW